MVKTVIKGSPEHNRLKATMAKQFLVEVQLGKLTPLEPLRIFNEETKQYQDQYSIANYVFVIEEGWEVPEGMQCNGQTMSVKCILSQAAIKTIKVVEHRSEEWRDLILSSEGRTAKNIKPGEENVVGDFRPGMTLIVPAKWAVEKITARDDGGLDVSCALRKDIEHSPAIKATVNKAGVQFYIALDFQDGSSEKYFLLPQQEAKKSSLGETNKCINANLAEMIAVYNKTHPEAPMPTIFAPISYKVLETAHNMRETKKPVGEAKLAYSWPKFDESFTIYFQEGHAVQPASAEGVLVPSMQTLGLEPEQGAADLSGRVPKVPENDLE